MNIPAPHLFVFLGKMVLKREIDLNSTLFAANLFLEFLKGLFDPSSQQLDI